MMTKPGVPAERRSVCTPTSIAIIFVLFVATIFVLAAALVLILVLTVGKSAKCDQNVKGMELSIKTTWDGHPTNHPPTEIKLGFKEGDSPVVTIDFTTPYYNDPPPPKPNGYTDGLWDYEVVEVFVANDKQKYVEMEFGPHGNWLIYLLDGVRKPFNMGESLTPKVQNKLEGDLWTAHMEVPLAFFPPDATSLNAYAIHGTGDNRVYEALSPAVGNFSGPDFHKLQFFKRVDRSAFIPACLGPGPYSNDKQYGNLWEGHQ
ncbi:unnamed protein product, partial [Mesorhabditis spiculigera]